MKRQNKRTAALGAALLLALGLAACGGKDAGSGAQVDSGDSAVIDEANVLSADTENYVTNLSVALQESCGAQIGVYTVEYIGNTTMEAFAYDKFNSWGLGDAEKDNGVMLLLAIGEDDYWAMRGAGLESQLSIATLSSLLDSRMEPSWLQGDYDGGTRATVRALAEQLCGVYGLTMDLDAIAMGTAGNGAAPADGDGGNGVAVLLIIIAVILLLWIIGMSSRSRRRGPPPPPPAGYGGYTAAPPRRSGGFGSGFSAGLGFGVGQSVGRRMFGGGTRRAAPPPPPPGGMRGGYSAPPRAPRPSAPRPSAPRSGGMGGVGRSAGGGIGRSGGSFRAGGGMTRGGGAGRRP